MKVLQYISVAVSGGNDVGGGGSSYVTVALGCMWRGSYDWIDTKVGY
jgi:hypothetical protein